MRVPSITSIMTCSVLGLSEAEGDDVQAASTASSKSNNSLPHRPYFPIPDASIPPPILLVFYTVCAGFQANDAMETLSTPILNGASSPIE